VWRFLLSVAIAICASQVALELAILVFDEDVRLRQLVFRPGWMLLLLAGFVWMLTSLDGVRERPLAAMGLPGGKLAIRHALAGVGIGAAMAAVTVVVIALGANLSFTAQLNLRRDFPTFLVEVFLVLSTGAMAEELIFRGYPFQRLVEATGAGGAVAVLSALFGVMHLRNPNASTVGFLNTMLIGVLFAVAYLRARTLWAPWGMHWAWNTVIGLLGLPVSGIDMSIGVHAKVTGPAWLTGGAYGPEASVACTLAVVGALVVAERSFRRDAEAETGIQPG